MRYLETSCGEGVGVLTLSDVGALGAFAPGGLSNTIDSVTPPLGAGPDSTDSTSNISSTPLGILGAGSAGAAFTTPPASEPAALAPEPPNVAVEGAASSEPADRPPSEEAMAQVYQTAQRKAVRLITY